MVTTLLDRLGTLVSRQFVVAYFMPVLVFGFLNALLLAWQSPDFRRWAPAQFEGFKGLYAVPVLVGLAVVAYLMFSVNEYLRQVLEGRRLLPDWLLRILGRGERRRHDELTRDHQDAEHEFQTIARAKSEWRRQLIDAGDRGHAKPKPNTTYNASHSAATQLTALMDKQRRGQRLLSDEVKAAVVALGGALEQVDREKNAELNDAYLELLGLLDDAEAAWNSRRLALFGHLEMHFGLDEPCPTRMGNVAAALDSYALTRYRMNLDTFWSRMQPALLTNEKFFGILTEAKTQLDFLVMSCWLSILTAMAWWMATPWLHFSWMFHLTVTLGAPLLGRVFYELAVENYLVFSEIVKSAVDLFRFSLLKSLHMPQPTGIRQERELWSALQELSTFGKEGRELSYQHDAS